MKAFLRVSSLVLFALLSLFLIWFGWLYASVDDMLWFHAAAVPAAARGAVRPLYLALMNLIGGASFALGAASLYVVLMPMRRGVAWAATLLTSTFAMVFAMAAITAEELAALTGSPTSWHIMGALSAVACAAFLAHVLSNALRPAARSGRDAGVDARLDVNA